MCWCLVICQSSTLPTKRGHLKVLAALCDCYQHAQHACSDVPLSFMLAVPPRGACRHSSAAAARGGAAGAESPHHLSGGEQRDGKNANGTVLPGMLTNQCISASVHQCISTRMRGAIDAFVTVSRQTWLATCDQGARECRVLEIGRVLQHAEGLLLQQDTVHWLCAIMSRGCLNLPNTLTDPGAAPCAAVHTASKPAPGA
jgi:hypothetical protein